MLLSLNYIYFIRRGRDTHFAAFCMRWWGQEVPCWTVSSICFCLAFCWWLSSSKSFCFMMEIWKVSKTEVRNTGINDLLRTAGNSALTSQKADTWQKKNWWSQATTSTWLYIISSGSTGVGLLPAAERESSWEHAEHLETRCTGRKAVFAHVQ